MAVGDREADLLAVMLEEAVAEGVLLPELLLEEEQLGEGGAEALGVASTTSLTT